MSNRLARILSLALAGAIVSGCATYETQDNPYAASPGPPYPGATIEREEPIQAP